MRQHIGVVVAAILNFFQFFTASSVVLLLIWYL